MYCSISDMEVEWSDEEMYTALPLNNLMFQCTRVLKNISMLSFVTFNKKQDIRVTFTGNKTVSIKVLISQNYVV